MSYDLASDSNQELAYSKFRQKRPYQPTTRPETATAPSINELMDPSISLDGLPNPPPGTHIRSDLQGSIHPLDIVWIGGICYHGALLHLPRTNDTPAFVREHNSQR